MTETIYQGRTLRRVSILGAGESGIGTAMLCKKHGIEVFLSDHGTIADKHVAELEGAGIPYEQGQHSVERIFAADIVVKSPGIPNDAPIIKDAVAKGIPVVSEIEFAYLFLPAGTRLVAITGSNGKTTTTMLTTHLLRCCGHDAAACGNIGVSLARLVADEPHAVYVIELSSFQLDNMYTFHPDVAMLLNITPDHLDRYDHKMENYIAAKLRVFQNLGPSDLAVYWADDPVVAPRITGMGIRARLCTFADGHAATVEACDGVIHDGIGGMDIPVAGIATRGTHNLLNAMAAIAACAKIGARAEAVAEGLKTFAPVEHRLEDVATIDGVHYINDSKATNVNSTYYALIAMTTPTVLILGGKDKGNDYSEILPLVKEKVHDIVAMGLHNEKIIEYFTANGIPVADTHSLDDALAACRAVARSGDTVLLSPCCASFDLFTSYEDRGRRFKAAVHALAPAN